MKRFNRVLGLRVTFIIEIDVSKEEGKQAGYVLLCQLAHTAERI
jgi:hypothetical protein